MAMLFLIRNNGRGCRLIAFMASMDGDLISELLNIHTIFLQSDNPIKQVQIPTL